MSSSTIYIGTSGWAYRHWKGPFYPQPLPSKDWLSYYSHHFQTVEINNTFYRLPSADAIERWRTAVPGGFVFSVKASRYITHMKKLRDPKKNLQLFFDHIEAFGDKLGPVLFQLPPNLCCDHIRLSRFLSSLSRDFHYAFEFRDPSWFNETTYGLLSRYGAACCIYDLSGFSSPQPLLADFAYVRLHGPRSAYRGSYGDGRLAQWADRFGVWAAKGMDIYCYFDNDQEGYAAMNAQDLRSLLHRTSARYSI